VGKTGGMEYTVMGKQYRKDSKNESGRN